MARRALVLEKEGIDHNEIAKRLNRIVPKAIKQQRGTKPIDESAVENLISRFSSIEIREEDQIKNTPKIKNELVKKRIRADYFR